MIHHMAQIILPEVPQGGHHRLAGRLPQAAQGRVRDGIAKRLQQIQIGQTPLVIDDALQRLQHTLCALPAGGALAAALVLGKVHKEPCHLHHAGVLVHDHQAAGADNGPQLLQRVEVHRVVQMLLGQTSAGRPADLHGLELLSVRYAAADVEDDLPQGGAHRHLHQSCVHHVARQGEGLGAGAALGADAPVPCRTLVDDARHVGERLHIVQHRGLSPQSLVYRPGRLYPGHTPLALDGGGQGAALTADEGAGAAVDVDMEAEPAAHDVVAQQSGRRSLVDGHLQTLHRQRILGADVDVALVRAGGCAGDHHALQHGMGIALHDGAVHESARVALVAVADDVLHRFLRVPAHAFPLTSGGKPAAAPAPQTGVGDLPADRRAIHVEQRLFKGDVPALGNVFLQIFRVTGAAAGQHHPVLLLVKGDILLPGIGHAVLVIGQPFDDLAAQQRPLHDLAAILRLHADIHHTQRLDMHQRSHLAEAVAATHLDVQALLHVAVVGQAHIHLQSPLGTLLPQVLIHLHGPAGDTARTGTDQHVQG